MKKYLTEKTVALGLAAPARLRRRAGFAVRLLRLPRFGVENVLFVRLRNDVAKGIGR